MSSFPIIPNYQVTRLIQEGGTSAVYEGINLHSGRVVAIKALFPSKLKDKYLLKRFKEEANHYLLLEHPNIPKLVDYIELDGQVFLIMEYVKGIDMSKYLQANGPLSEDMTINFFSLILEAVGFLHSKGILHLDIKPSNIMVMENLDIKILDLGISSKMSEGEPIKKKCGSPAFMAPEQINGGKLDVYTDIYQIGVTLFNMVTGKLPYNGKTQKEIFDNICNQSVPQLKDFSESVHGDLQPVIDKAMQKEGKDRYTSCEEFKKALLDSFSTVLDDGIGEEPKNEIIEETNNNMRIITVGREIGNDVVINNGDLTIGRHHLQLIKDEAGVFFVRDLNSTNGTFVNGRRIAGEAQIDEHDIIRIGRDTILPWINYFSESEETIMELDDAKKKRRRRKKKTPEEIKARKEKIKKTFGKIWRWILGILSSVIMMLIFMKIMELIRSPHV